jgi:hypothetical protein
MAFGGIRRPTVHPFDPHGEERRSSPPSTKPSHAAPVGFPSFLTDNAYTRKPSAPYAALRDDRCDWLLAGFPRFRHSPSVAVRRG